MKYRHFLFVYGLGAGLLLGILLEHHARLRLPGDGPVAKDAPVPEVVIEPARSVAAPVQMPFYAVAAETVKAPREQPLVPGLLAFPVDGGRFALKLEEPRFDPTVSSRDLVTLWATLTNLSDREIRRVTLLAQEYKYTSAVDDFGNTLYATYHHRNPSTPTLYPGESVRLGWVYGRPVPGSTVTYKFGLDGRVGVVRHHWPRETK